MAKAGSASISTNVFSKSFLAKAWADRQNLEESERRGLAQFIYLTICGHLESGIARLVATRVQMIRNFSHWKKAGEIVITRDHIESRHSIDLLVDSMLKIMGGLESEIGNAPLSKLIEIYGRAFPFSFNDVVGKDLAEDVGALATLRNIFAHGRNLTVDFSPDVSSDMSEAMDGNSLKQAASRLRKAKIIGSFNIRATNFNQFLSLFYGDEAILHFYKAVQEVETKLYAANLYEPERDQLLHASLPSLAKK